MTYKKALTIEFSTFAYYCVTSNKVKMIRRILLSVILYISASVVIAGNSTISIDSIVSGYFKPKQIADMNPMDDAGYYSSISENGRKLSAVDYLTGKNVRSLIDLDNVKGTKIKKIAGYMFDGVGKRILIWEERKPVYRRSFTTEYYVYDIKRNYLEPLSEKGGQRNAKFSPDGRSVAFCRDNNIYIKRLDFGSELEVTTDGAKNSVINGTTDWVYEEEFEETGAFEWSPDSQSLAYLKFDEKNVSVFSFTKFGAYRLDKKEPVFYPGSYSYKYPSAGGENSKVSLMVYQLQSRSSKKLNIPVAEDGYIPKIMFTKRNNQLAVVTLNRDQNILKMFYVNPKSSVATLILTDQNDTYVDPSFIDAIDFSTKSFTYLSEKDGYRQLYLYSSNGVLLKKLTSGNRDVTDYLGSDTINNLYFYQAVDGTPMEKSIYQVDGKGKMTKISTRKGLCTAVFNSGRNLFIQTASDLNTPPVICVCNLKGKELRTITDNAELKNKLGEVKVAQKTFFKVPAADGTLLNGWMLKPFGFDEKAKYPVIQIQYSGPDNQMVLDKYNFDWEYYLAENGFIVVCVDGRGTGGRGYDFRRSTFKNLGQLESKDQIAVSKYLKSFSYVDGGRIGIWGWSFGGFITLMSMTDSESIFKAGIAVAPVCDYRYYNTVYTERFMRTPGQNKEGYDAGSPLMRAGSLKGNLLLVHGLEDDNVRANQSIDFVEELIKSGIQFDTQFYPTSSHSILGITYRKHLYRKMADFFIDKLK